jgi:endonuclease YncB( thermonuclease family)
MNLRSRTTRFVVALAASLSLVAGVVTVPATSASASSVGVSAAASIGAKKKVLTTEQKNAKKALDAAVKDLAKKEKLLAAAVKAQAKTGKAHAKAAKAAETAQVRNVKGASKKVKAKAKAAAKKLATAKGKDDRALALVARRTVMRDTAQAKVIRLDAKYAWLMKDLSTLQCGVGESVTTASGAVEVVRECGIVYMHEDGDTTHVKTTTNQMIEIRNIGLQTPERKKGSNPAQCGADAAYENFKELMPEEITIVQLRSIADSTNGWGGGARPLRSVYKLNNATGAFDIDVQAEQVKAGWSLWWPLDAEWAHNKEYLDYMNDAKARGVGLWNPNLCGAATGGVPSMWFSQNAPTIDTDTEPAFGEYLILKNETTAVMDLTNWMLRDNSLNFFWDAASGGWMQGLNKFGSMVLAPGEHRIIYLDNPTGHQISPATEYEYFNWSRNTPGAQLTNGSIGGLKGPNYINGDGLYLQDPNGNIRNSMTNPCTSAAMCETPAWVTEIISSTRAGQIIPIPVALNKVANTTRDLYNPKVVIVSGVAKYVSEFNPDGSAKTYVDLANKFNVLTGTAIDSVQPLGTLLDLSLTTNGASLLNTRVPIADETGRNQTAVYKRLASGSNTVPNLIGMTDAAARAAIVAAGFTVGTVTPTATSGASGVATQVETGSKPLGTAISFTVNTQTIG